ncbi:MAG: site-specific integrase [Patescibacteria group bacterium]
MFAQIKQFSSNFIGLFKRKDEGVSGVVENQEYAPSPQPLSAKHCVELFLKELSSLSVSKSTLRNYSSDILQFLDFSNDDNIQTVLSEQNFKGFFADQQEKGLKSSSIQRKIVSLKLFSNWVEKNYLSTESQHTETPQVVTPPTPTLTPTPSASTTSIQELPAFFTQRPPSQNQDELSAKETTDEKTADRKKYQDWILGPYFHLATLVIFFIFISILWYRQFFVNVPEKFAFPAAPVTADRILSFQARLTDVAGTPITTATNTTFKLWDASSAGNLLWNSGTCSIDPDQDGIFSTILGSTCGSAIDATVFTENSQVWLEITVVSDVLTPRQRIATVPYALNAETLQGFPVNATAGASKSTVVVMNQWGEVLLGEQSPQLRSVGGTFTISGATLNLVTNSGSNGNIIIDPDGTGTINLNGNVINDGYIFTHGATISATYAGSTPLVINGTGGQVLTVNNAGDITTAGDLAVNGGDITSTGDLTINPAGGNVIFSNNTVLNIGGAGAQAYNFFADSTAGNSTAATDNDLYIQDVLEVDGAARFDGTVTVSALNTAGGIVYTNGSGQLLTSASGSGGDCLKSGGTGAPTWGACAGGGGSAGTWTIANGAHYPINETLDLLIGGTSTASAKFAIINVDSGTPTASLSAGAAGGAYLTATGILQTTADQTLTLGGTTTGDISFLPLNGAGNITADLGTTSLFNVLDGNLKIGNGTPGLTLDGEDAYIEGTFEVDGQAQFDGNVDATNGLDVTGSNLTVGGGNFSVAPASGNITTAGDLAVNGGDITTAGDLTINASGNNVLLADGNTLGVGGAAGTTFNFFADSTAGNSTAATDNDLYIQDVLEVDGAARFDGTVTFSTLNTAGGIVYTNGSGQLLTSTAGSGGDCLKSGGTGAPTWGTCGSGGNAGTWTIANGAHYPVNETLDLLIGGTSTASAKFAIINVDSGTPTASLSAGAAGGAYLTATGVLQTTADQTLTLGGTTTGDISFLPLNGAGNITADLGTTSLFTILDGNLKVGNGTPNLTQDGEDAYIEGTFEVDGQAQFDGNVDATNGLDVTGANLTVGGANFSVAQASGNITTAGDLAVNGGDITTTGDLTINAAGNNVIFADGNTLNVGGAAAAAFNFFADSTAGNSTAASDNDLYIQDVLEVDGAVRFDSSLTLSTFTTNGGLLYTNGSGVVAQTTAGSSGECLVSNAGGAPTWTSCSAAGSNFWRIANGAISPVNDTLDLLIGNTATTSAKFAIINVNSGNPTASLSAGTAGGAYLNATGTLQTTDNQALTIGGATTGDITLLPLNGAGAITADLGAATLFNILDGNLKVGNGTPGLTQNGEDGYIEGTFEVDGQAQFDGNVDATNGLDVTGANLTVGGANFSVAQASGNITTAGDLAVNGGDITTTGDLTISAAGNNVIFADGNTLNVGGAAAAAFNFFASSTATNNTADGDNDLYVQDEFEVDGAVRFDSSLTLSTFTTDGGLLYTNGSGVVAQTGQGSAGECLKSNAGGAPTFSACASANYWRIANGAISPVNDTLDLLIGNTATTSAKFAVLNVNSGTPTASLSAGDAGGAYLTAAGSLQTTANQKLTVGGATTGDINFLPLNGLGTVSVTSDLAQGARTTSALSVTQASNGSNNSASSLVSFSNSDTGSTSSVLDLSQTAANTWLGFSSISSATSGIGISMTGNTSGAISAFTGDYIKVNPGRTLTSGSIDDTGNYLDLNRSNTVNGGTTYTISGDLASFTSTCTQTSGTCTDTSNIISAAQNYANASGSVIDITNAGTGQGILLTSSSTGVLAQLDSTGAVTTADGLLIRAVNASGVITDALDVSDAEIVNAINVGDNFILGNGIRQFSSSSSVWTIEDTSGNDIATFTDGGTTGDLVLTNTISAYGNSIGLNNDASANNTLSFGAGAGQPTGDLYWGSRLLCTAASVNCGWIGSTTTTLQNAYDNDADGSNALITLNATDGSLVIRPIAGTNFQVSQVTSAPTGDMVAISNAGLGTTTANASGIGLTFVTGDGASITNNGLNIALTSGGTSAGDILNGINLTLTGTGGTETGINIGSGFDTGIAIVSAVGNEAIDLSPTAGIRTTALIDINENNTSGSAPTIQWDSAETRGGFLDANITGALSTENFIDLTTSGAFTSNLIDVNIGAQAATGDVINIDLGATAVNAQALVVGNSASVRTASMFEVNDNNSTGAVATFDLNGAGTRGGLFDIDWSGALATENLIDITANSIATANALNITENGLTTGRAINVSSTSTVLTTSDFANFDWSPSGSTEIFASAGSSLLTLNVGTYGNISKIFSVQDDSSEVFGVSQSLISNALPAEFTAAGDVAIAYDIQFTNQTASFIKSNGPLTIASGETFENNNLTLRTYGTGLLNVDAPGGSLFTVSGTTVASFNRNTSDGTIISLQQDGTQEGSISVSGTTVSYNAFTGSHYAWTDQSINKGEIVTLTDDNRRLGDRVESEILYGVVKSTVANDPKILGSYLALQESSQPASNKNPQLIMAAGNGEVWVVDQGENLQAGDYLISSNVEGHAMKEAGQFDKSYIFARVAEPVDWSTVTTTTAGGKKHKLISVLYESFVKDNAMGLTLSTDGSLSSNYTIQTPSQSANGRFSVIADATSQVVSRVGVFARLIVGEIQAGLITTKELIADRITIKDKLITPKVQTSLISPISGQQLSFNLGDADQNKLHITNKNNQDILTIDQQGNTDIVGTISAQQDLIASGSVQASTGRFEQLKAQQAQLASLEVGSATISGELFLSDGRSIQNIITDNDSYLASLSAQTEQITQAIQQAPQTVKSSAFDQFMSQLTGSSDASVSAAIQSIAQQQNIQLTSEDLVLAPSALFVKEYLSVAGYTQLNSASVSSNLTIGNNLLFTGDTIAVAGQTLFIQPTNTATVNILAGLLVLNPDGNVEINGDLVVNGNLAVKQQLNTNAMQLNDYSSDFTLKLATESAVLGESTQSKFSILDASNSAVASIDASGSARFKDLATQGIVIKQPVSQATDSASISQAAKNKTAGSMILPALATELTIENNNVSENGLIYLTPTSDTANQVLYLKSKETCNGPLALASCQKSFTVGIKNAVTQDINFNFWIVKVE